MLSVGTPAKDVRSWSLPGDLSLQRRLVPRGNPDGAAWFQQGIWVCDAFPFCPFSAMLPESLDRDKGLSTAALRNVDGASRRYSYNLLSETPPGTVIPQRPTADRKRDRGKSSRGDLRR